MRVIAAVMTGGTSEAARQAKKRGLPADTFMPSPTAPQTGSNPDDPTGTGVPGAQGAPAAAPAGPGQGFPPIGGAPGTPAPAMKPTAFQHPALPVMQSLINANGGQPDPHQMAIVNALYQ